MVQREKKNYRKERGGKRGIDDGGWKDIPKRDNIKK